VDAKIGNLVIEIDGPGHDRPRTRREDEARDATLTAAGYAVLRLTPDDLM
jgi:very-short-patch-repair endonuclease